MRVIILGRGRVGRGLCTALRGQEGVHVRLGRGTGAGVDLSKADVVLLAVPDDAIAEVASNIEPRLTDGTVVLHCAGARGPQELAVCAPRAHVGVAHPLVSFADPQRPPSVEGAGLVIDGDRRAVRAARTLAKAAGMRALVSPIHGPAYHAAAALVANGAATLAMISVRLLGKLDVDQRRAEKLVGALLRTVGENVERIGVPDALTGPIRRGDGSTVHAHRTALAGLDRTALTAYDAIGPSIATMAGAAGLDTRSLRAVRRALRLGM